MSRKVFKDIPEAFVFDVEETGRGDQGFDMLRVCLKKGIGFQKACPFEVGYGESNIVPCSILGEYSAEDDFKVTVSRPPFLRTIGGVKRIEYLNGRLITLHWY